MKLVVRAVIRISVSFHNNGSTFIQLHRQVLNQKNKTLYCYSCIILYDVINGFDPKILPLSVFRNFYFSYVQFRLIASTQGP